ncbi:uncharacterized protein LOC115417411 isoform X2 [Sphaeramia orbicularis]|uniref:uncharacterized protein LOC115417411 isoform X2 n=1 Tax=Sphaeramia orbicularis TaxID=375764 RepID=UPI001180CF75|nr:uncharacterized protein LOC115417411 isoform X2 [Sphaeramia orbicularis]
MTDRPTQMADTSPGLGEVLEKTDSSDSESSSDVGSEEEYHPNTPASSSEEEWESPEKLSSQKNGKYTINKGKNPQKYQKRRSKQNTKETEVTSTVSIKTCTKRGAKKRTWDKKHYCFYCNKAILKMARHLQRKHMDKKDVAYAFSFEIGSKQRKVLLEKLRNKGDYKHNTHVLEKGSGELITWKQPSKKASAKDYLPCPHCYGMFVKWDLWRHQSVCRSKKHLEGGTKKTRSRVQSLAATLLPNAALSGGCEDIINKMRQDDVSFHIRSDVLICRYGDALYAKHGRVKSRHQYIAQRLRELGRFMLVAKQMDKTVKVLQDVCVPSKFKFVVNVAKKLTEFSPGKNEYGKPSTAVKIGFCLKGAVQVLIGQALMNDDDLEEKRGKKFLELLDKNWKCDVSVSAHQSIQEKRWNKQDDIPLTRDVMTLRNHLRMVEDKARDELTQQQSLMAYRTLNETVLAQVIVFNKRREGEASRLTVEAYKKACTNPINQDIYETLSPLEKELSKLLTRIEVRGKRSRKVPIFLTERMKNSVDLLVTWREKAGVLEENPYLFARPGVMTSIRGCDCLRKYAVESKAENPELLRSTKLRKQVATLCQLLDLSEQELEQVARFMGHDIRVHRDFYRQTDKTFQIAKISKLLFAMEEGTRSLAGKNLKTIEPFVCGESSTSTSDVIRRKTGREVDEDGDPEMSSTKGMDPLSDRETAGSDTDDEGAEILLTQKNKPQTKKRLKRHGDPEMSSRKGMDPLTDRETAGSDTDDGDPEMSSTKGTDPLADTETAGSDTDNVSQGVPLTQSKKTPPKKQQTPPSKSSVKRPWTEKEKSAVNKHLGRFVGERKVPGKKDCTACIEQERALAQRSWKDVKNFVYNTIVAHKRRDASRFLKF